MKHTLLGKICTANEEMRSECDDILIGWTQVAAKICFPQGTILPGVTRKSVIQLARLRGYNVEEAAVSVEEAMNSDEVFTTGTAVVLCAVGSLTYKVCLLSMEMLWSQIRVQY